MALRKRASDDKPLKNAKIVGATHINAQTGTVLKKISLKRRGRITCRNHRKNSDTTVSRLLRDYCSNQEVTRSNQITAVTELLRIMRVTASYYRN